MKLNTRRAIIRRVKKGWEMKAAYRKMMENKNYERIDYSDFVRVKIDYFKKFPSGWYKRCTVCDCEHPYTAEVFWFNWFDVNGNRKLHSKCLASRRRINKNKVIIKWAEREEMRKVQKKSYEKNKHNRKKFLIGDLSEEEQEKKRAKWRIQSAEAYLKKKNGKKKNK